MSEKRLLPEGEPAVASSYGSVRSEGSIPNYWLNPTTGPQPHVATYRDTPTYGPQGYPPSTRSVREQQAQAIMKQPSPPPSAEERPVPPPKYPPDYVCLSVVTTVAAVIFTAALFWCCTVPALICASYSHLARRAGNYERARSCSRKAFCCNAACFISGAILYSLLAFSGAIAYIVIVTLQADKSN